MTLSMPNPQFYYELFYSLAFTFMFCIVIYKCIKKGYHLRSVLLLFTTLIVFIIVGTRLFTIPVNHWLDAIQVSSLEFNNRSSIGGIFFGFLGLLIVQWLFKFGKNLLDVFAWVAPIALGITKLGCLFNGCCYGLATNGFWGIHYPVGTNAHHNNFLAGHIANDSMDSLALHPVQLYETLILIAIGCIVWRMKDKWKGGFSSILFALSLYFSLRFAIEFFRDHSVSQFGSLHYLGIWVYQWGMLAIGFLLGMALWILEKNTKIKDELLTRNSPYLRSELIYIACLSVIIYSFQNLLTTFENKVIWIFFIPAILFSCYHLFFETRLKHYGRLIGLVFFAPIFVFAQTLQKDSLNKIKQYKRIDIGGSFGNFVNEVAFDPQQVQNVCGTNTTTYSYEYFKQVYQVGGIGYSQITQKNDQTTRWGVNLSGGNIKSTNLTTNEYESEFIYAVNPYIKWDSKWFGVGAGFQIGKLRINKEERLDVSNIEDAQKNYTLLPEFYARVGPRRYLDIDYNYGFMMPSAFPTLYSRSSIGSAFGLSEDYSFRYGHIWNLDTDFISAEALLTDNLGINIMYVFKENNFEFQEEGSGKLVLSLNYRFGHKQK